MTEQVQEAERMTPAATDPAVEKVTRNYRYRLKPLPVQESSLLRAMRSSRRLWNHLVTVQDASLRAVRNGRKERLVSELTTIYLKKRLVGMLASKVKRYVLEKSIPADQARGVIASEQAAKHAKYRRSLAVQCAIESSTKYVESHWPHSVSSMIRWGTLGHYQDAAKQWAFGKRGILRRKRANDSAPLRWQLGPNSPWTLEEVVRLAPFGQICDKVACIVHRPLPLGAIPKQLSVTRDSSGAWYLTVSIDCPRNSVLKDFGPASGLKAGINPGIRLRLVVVDSASDPKRPSGFAIDRPTHRQDRQDRKLARLLRKADRQVRANNPECFDEQGRWKKGARAKVRSLALTDVRAKMAQMQLHAAAVRGDHYHKSAARLLRLYETIAVGTWRPAQTREAIDANNPPGTAIRRRATNRKVYRQAISTFISALEDKAALSKTPRSVLTTDEKDTTRKCPVCGALEGPTGKEGLAVRTWQCSCGTINNREFAAAFNISQFTAPAATTGQPSARKGRKRRVDDSPQGEPNAGGPTE